MLPAMTAAGEPPAGFPHLRRLASRAEPGRSGERPAAGRACRASSLLGLGPAPRTLTQRLRGMSGTAKIVSAGAALLVAAIAVVSLAGAGTGAAPRALPTAKNFTLPELGHPGRQVSLAAFAGLAGHRQLFRVLVPAL